MMIGPYQVAGAFQRVVAAGKCHLMIQHPGHVAWRLLRQARRQQQNHLKVMPLFLSPYMLLNRASVGELVVAELGGHNQIRTFAQPPVTLACYDCWTTVC